MTSLPSQKCSDDVNGRLSFPNKDGSGRLASVAFGVTQDIILQKINESMSRLNSTSDITTASCCSDLKYIWHHLRKSESSFKGRILKILNNHDLVVLVQKSWKSVEKVISSDHQEGDAWMCIKLTTSLLWVSSDELLETCEKISRSGFLLTILRHLQVVSKERVLENSRKLFFVKALLGLVHNVLRNHSQSKQTIRNEGGVKILKDLYESGNSANMMIKAKSLIVLSYLVDEKESEIIHASSDTISFILGILEESLSSVDHFSTKYGMNSHEIVLGLNNIVLEDANKLTVVKCGAIPLYTRLLESSVALEQTAAANGVWCLSFIKENKLWIKEEQQCIKALECLANKGSTSAGRAARGALWEIFRAVELTNKGELGVNCRHVMISYQWESQPIMIKVKDKLKEAGYKVWMDVEHMTGSTLEAMALAVEQAAVILICMTEKYKESPSCRTESEYIFRLHKDIIPLRLQHKFSPDGWLGILVGSRLYFDFSKEELIEKQIPKLIKELGPRGRISKLSNDIVDGVSVKQLPQKSEPIKTAVSSWTKDRVHDWLESVGLKTLSDKMVDVDGVLLTEMVKLQRRAPEYFYSSVKSEFSLSFCDTLRLSKELNSLHL